jgi:hypothetical protein
MYLSLKHMSLNCEAKGKIQQYFPPISPQQQQQNQNYTSFWQEKNKSYPLVLSIHVPSP